MFGRGTNPRIDPPILRKSESYAALQVEAGRADWLNPADHSQGILCRELIYFGPRAVQVETVSVTYCFTGSGELPGLRFIPPPTIHNPTLPALQMESLFVAAPSWDWSQESSQAQA